jgi:hypothetical protein
LFLQKLGKELRHCDVILKTPTRILGFVDDRKITKDNYCEEIRVSISLSPGPSSPRPSSVTILKSASTKISLVTNQQVTRGLFKRLDGVIAYAEEITNPGPS